MLALRIDDPDAAGAGAIDVAFDVALHAVRRAGALVGAHVAEQPLRAEIEHAVAFNIVRHDQLAMRIGVVEIKIFSSGEKHKPFGLTKDRVSMLICLRSAETR